MIPIRLMRRLILPVVACFCLPSCATDGTSSGFVGFMDRLDDQMRQERLARASAPQVNYYGGGNAGLDYFERTRTPADYEKGLRNFQQQSYQHRLDQRLDDIEEAVNRPSYRVR